MCELISVTKLKKKILFNIELIVHKTWKFENYKFSIFWITSKIDTWIENVVQVLNVCPFDRK